MGTEEKPTWRDEQSAANDDELPRRSQSGQRVEDAAAPACYVFPPEEPVRRWLRKMVDYLVHTAAALRV